MPKNYGQQGARQPGDIISYRRATSSRNQRATSSESARTAVGLCGLSISECGRYARILRGLTGVQLLILDDWGLDPLDAGARRDLYEILEERYGRRSTILTSQIPVDKWHAFIGEPTTS